MKHLFHFQVSLLPLPGRYLPHLFYLTMILSFFASDIEAKKSIHIFMPCEFSAVDIENEFMQNYPGFTVRAFGNVTDFKKSIIEQKPDAIITKPYLLKYVDGYTERLSAIVNGSPDEPYLLLSIDNPIAISDINGKSIGILDFLGKKEIDSFVAVQTKARPTLTKVKKLADLLPLLTMNMVDGVFVSDFQAAYLKKRSRMNLVENRCTCASGVGVLAVANPDPAITDAVKKMSGELSKMLGIDSWQIAAK